MHPFNKYIIVSTLRGRTPETIIGSLRSIGLSTDADLEDFVSFRKSATVKKDIAKLKGVQDPEKLIQLLETMERYNVKDFLMPLATFNEVWSQHWDILTTLKYKRFVLTLLTAGYETDSITKELNVKYSINFVERAVLLVRDYYWDLRKLNSVERITACEAVTDTKLKKALLSIVDGDKYEAVADVGAKRIPGYEVILEEILADAYAHYKKYYKKKDANSRAQLKVWLDVIIKIGDRHNKLKPKNTDELDALIKKLEIDKKDKSEIPSLQNFIKENEILS